MKPKQIATMALLGFVGLSLVVLAFKETRPAQPAPGEQSASPVQLPQPAETPEVPQKNSIIAVTYFHGDYRCSTCTEMEKLSRESVQESFGDQLQSGAMQWRLVNFDRPENARYLKQFELVSQSLVLTEERGGAVERWVNLSDIWVEIHEGPAAFKDFVAESVANFAAGGGGENDE